jgi:hypothetical protein
MYRVNELDIKKLKAPKEAFFVIRSTQCAVGRQ